ncbi:MAG: hypothetical protein IIC27_00965 [Chloroflexi bacterium]|nr:hypothetical protein [Chloroflexota bacterium]
MTTSSTKPKGVHLVGSIPLKDSAEVFQTLGTSLGTRLRRMPDGETGERSGWIRWQLQVFLNHPMFELAPADPDSYTAQPQYRLRPETASDQLTFGPLGYSAAAKSSYAEFLRLKQEGRIPAGCRFQVSLPTPLAPIAGYVVAADRAVVGQAYERRLLEELGEIMALVPAHELAVQWDVAVEFRIWESVSPEQAESVKKGLIEGLVRLGDAIPAEVELGYHLCYGDSGHKHFMEPVDTANMVEVANSLSAGVGRAINWIHMPVPHARTADAYFAPLTGLKLSTETELYLGLVHFTDGVVGTQRRIEAAQRVVTTFGVATECGFGRRSPETISGLLKIHTDVSDPLT